MRWMMLALVLAAGQAGASEVFDTRGQTELRMGPGTLFPPLATLAPGTRLAGRGCAPGLFEVWCEVETVAGARLRGFVAQRDLAAAGPSGGGGAGPDRLVVSGLRPGDTLNLRSQPTAQARIIATARAGEPLRNLGCEGQGGARWCRVQKLDGSALNGWASARFLREGAAPRPPAVGGGGGEGPDTLVVRGLPAGDRLNVRAQPTTQAGIVARLTEGERVANLGCEARGQTRWCRVRTVTGATGWASARYLGEG